MTQSPLLRPQSEIGGRFWKHEYLYVFLIGFGLAFLFFLPALIMGQGVFTFYGDYVVQQIPFYKHCHEMVRSGSFLWDWGTDLGANFIGSYSFYLLGSPFFWLTIPFPTAWVPYLMAPLFFIKFGTASVTAYLYIKRFTAKREYAVLGALLYAFSGFQIYNIFFNHFHDVVALFPLLLVGIEELVTKNRKGVFAIAVFLTAACNYFFFVGEVVFVLLYFLIRVGYCSSWRMNLKKFGFLSLEAILGVVMAGIILLPSFFSVMSNPRVNSTLTGYNILFYGNVQRYAAILQSFLFPPELPSRINFFTDANNKWTSMAGWLPLFSLSGVFAYLMSKRKTWLKVIIVTSAVMMLVPVLNSVFVAMNGAYYARWYFMPVLMMALATVLALEDPKINMMRGLRFTAILTGIIVITVGFIPKDETSTVIDSGLTGFAAVRAKLVAIFTNGGLYEEADRFWLYSIIALVSLAILYLLLRYFRTSRFFVRLTALCTMLVILVTGVSFILTGRAISGNHEWVINDLINSRLELPDDPEDAFYRVDFPDSFDNVGIYWDYPQVTTFHSIVPRSIMDFYPVTGTPRDVGSRPETDRYGIRGMASCKYYFQRGTSYNADDPPMEGFIYRFTSNNVTVWENKYYIPMGYTYDTSINEEQLYSYAESDRDKVMMHSLYLSDEDAEKYKNLLTPITDETLPDVSAELYASDCIRHRTECCDSFSYSSSGFTATITTEKDELVFFSVPYEEGWSATVNGKKAEIVKSNVGFMSVVVKGGEASTIQFSYFTPGLKGGIIATILGFVLFAAYLLLLCLSKKKHKSPENALSGAGKAYPDSCLSCRRCFRKDRYLPPYLNSKLPDPFQAMTPPAELPPDGIPLSTDGTLPVLAPQATQPQEAPPAEAESTTPTPTPAPAATPEQPADHRETVDWLEELTMNPPDALTDDALEKLANDYFDPPAQPSGTEEKEPPHDRNSD